ncbi:MAG: hypothetical protein ACREIV_17075, partial [Planctomycetaceae bacterium]
GARTRVLRRADCAAVRVHRRGDHYVSRMLGWPQLSYRIPDAPLPRTDPALLEPVRVSVLRPFFLDGSSVTVGTTVRVPRYLARDLVAVGKAAYA